MLKFFLWFFLFLVSGIWQSVFAFEKPDLPDIDLLYIERLPRFDYDGPKKWPSEGEQVEFRAHVKNNGSQPTGEFHFSWKIDGRDVLNDVTSSLAPGEEKILIYRWVWAHSTSSGGRIEGSHTVELFLDSNNVVKEISENNNKIIDFTQGLAVGFWVEQSVYDFFNQNQYPYCQGKSCAGSNSWEDWAQRQIREWNKLFANSKYSSAPNGVLDRVRLDKITVVPDCSLPLNGGWIADNHPDITDKTVDLMWGFTSAKVGVIACFRDEQDGNKNLYFNYPEHQNIEWPLMHELSHARYLVDTYCFNVFGEDVLVKGDDDKLIAGTSFLPFIDGIHVYLNKDQKMMGGNFSEGYGEYSAGALNRVRGLRARGGNYNNPSVIGEYLGDLPSKNRFAFFSREGIPLRNAKIFLYQAVPRSGYCRRTIDNVADIVKTADNSGSIILERNPFGGISVNEGLFLFQIDYSDQTEYIFQEIGDFNLAFWQGETEEAEYVVQTKIHTPEQGASLVFHFKSQAISSQKPDQNLQVILKQEGEEKYRFNKVVASANNNGTYLGVVRGIAPGIYDVLIKGWAHLQKKFIDINLSLGRNEFDWSSAPLLVGDFDSNNTLNIFDLAMLIEQYTDLTVPVSESNKKFDVNLDGQIDIFDIALVLQNYTDLEVKGDD